MSDNKRITNVGCREQVALELMKFIYLAIGDDEYESEKDILSLYRKCHKATHNSSLDRILKED